MSMLIAMTVPGWDSHHISHLDSRRDGEYIVIRGGFVVVI